MEVDKDYAKCSFSLFYKHTESFIASDGMHNLIFKKVL